MLSDLEDMWLNSFTQRVFDAYKKFIDTGKFQIISMR